MREAIVKSLNSASFDVIFVPAGRISRKEYALNLYKRMNGGDLLLSVARFEIRRLPQLLERSIPLDLVGIASTLDPIERHFFVTLHGDHAFEVHYLPVYRFGTLREIKGLAAWLDSRPEVHSLLIVSSRFHLPRVALCCKALLPKRIRLRLLAVPNERLRWNTHRFARVRQLLSEFAKFWVYCILLAFSKPKAFETLVPVTTK